MYVLLYALAILRLSSKTMLPACFCHSNVLFRVRNKIAEMRDPKPLRILSSIKQQYFTHPRVFPG